MRASKPRVKRNDLITDPLVKTKQTTVSSMLTTQNHGGTELYLEYDLSRKHVALRKVCSRSKDMSTVSFLFCSSRNSFKAVSDQIVLK
jgi:hypothetical protein